MEERSTTMIIIPGSAIEAIHEKLAGFSTHYRPYQIGIWTVPVLGNNVPGVSLFFSDQRDGEWEEKYIIGDGGMIKLS